MSDFIGKLVSTGDDTLNGIGLVTKCEPVDNSRYVTHIILVTYPKTGLKEVHYVMNKATSSNHSAMQTFDFVK